VTWNRFNMTYETPEWDPTNVRFAVAKKSMTDNVGQLVESKERPNCTIVSALLKDRMHLLLLW
jgi:hypothetical protein